MPLPEGWELVVAGDGPIRGELERRARGLPVRFLGFLSHDRLADLYRSSEIFAFPSAVENFPMVLLEAMRAGCAVITSTAEGCREVAGEAARFVDAGDGPALAAAIRELIADPRERQRLSERALRRAAGFEPARIAGRLLDAFESILGDRKSLGCPLPRITGSEGVRS